MRILQSGKRDKVMVRGKFITFEGGEGTGKSTQVRLLADAMNRSGWNVKAVRSPGGTKVGEKLRSILKTREEGEELTAETELLLFGACHSQMVERLLKPGLADGISFISDRFFDSTMVYQGYARGLDLEMLERINAFSCRGLKPDLTILLDIEPELGMRRSSIRAAGTGALENDRFDSETLAFHTAVREGFLTIAAKEPERFRIISASGTIDEVAAAVKDCVNHEFGLEIL